ncbi:MAG: tetraacyldisaccharide 4'-kinase, partial [Ignavibacteria bacterium]|nr:tetraacyldisaccharide 4'-kinase [Ignavibacteria bacterium]
LLENLSSQESRCLVVTGEDKTKTAKFVCSKFRPDVIIIDDGFQHRKLGRDLDIVLVASEESHHLLPYGRLREPLGNISRADLIIRNMKFTENPGGTDKPDHKTTEIKYVTDGLFDIRGEKLIPEKNTPALIFSGIGDPQSFQMAAESLGVNIKNTFVFRDHYNFTSDDIRAIMNRFESESAELIITTHKDFIRMKNSELALKNPSDNIYRKLLFELPLYYLKIKIQITRNYDNLEKQLELLIRLI